MFNMIFADTTFRNQEIQADAAPSCGLWLYCFSAVFTSVCGPAQQQGSVADRKIIDHGEPYVHRYK